MIEGLLLAAAVDTENLKSVPEKHREPMEYVLCVDMLEQMIPVLRQQGWRITVLARYNTRQRFVIEAKHGDEEERLGCVNDQFMRESRPDNYKPTYRRR